VVGGVLQLLQRAHDVQLVGRQVGAEREVRQQPGLGPGVQLVVQRLGQVVAVALGQLQSASSLPCALACAHQFVLEARVGHGDQALDHFAVGLAAQVGHAVLGDDDVAQVARNGDVAVVPDDAAVQAVLVVVRGAQHQDRARVGQRMRHGHEVVLPAHAADHLAVFQRVAGRGAQQRHDHGGVHEARLAPLRALQLARRLCCPVELVDEVDARHVDARASSCGGMPRSRS
jgi:hypothetical protein